MELAQTDWRSYFRNITGDHQRLLVAIESVGPRVPVEERIEAMCGGVCTRHPLRAIGYEQPADVFEVAVGLSGGHGALLRFLVAEPRRISVREVEEARAIIVTDSGGARTIVCVFSMQPPPSATAARTRSASRNRVGRRQFPHAAHAGSRGQLRGVSRSLCAAASLLTPPPRAPRARASRTRCSPPAAT